MKSQRRMAYFPKLLSPRKRPGGIQCCVKACENEMELGATNDSPALEEKEFQKIQSHTGTSCDHFGTLDSCNSKALYTRQQRQITWLVDSDISDIQRLS